MLTQPSAYPAINDAEEAALSPRKRTRRRRLDRSSVGVLVLLVLAGAGLYYMHWRTRDGVEMLANADADATSLSTLLAGGQRSLTQLGGSIRATRDVVDRFSHRNEPRLAGARPPGADPFAFGASAHAADAAVPGTSSAGREQARTKAMAAAQRMQLQSILFGTARRSCLIDGRLYFEGQTCGDFTIVRIAADAVGVQAGEFRFELRLRK